MKIIFMSIPVTLVNVGIVPRRIPRVLGQMNLLEKKDTIMFELVHWTTCTVMSAWFGL